ncbi:MAG TPA: ice-binding family protein [Acidimicrobiales bacterium]
MSSQRSTLRRRGFASLAAAACAIAVVLVPSSAGAAIVATVPLGTSAQYAVLAGSTVTNSGASILNGSLGLSPGTSVTGFPPGQVVAPATTNIDNAAARQAQSDLTVAYVNAAGRPLDATTTADLANLTLQGGVYAGPSKGALALTGPLTLDGAGNQNSVFIFQTNSTLTTGTASSVNLINGAQACNVFWQVGSSATLGENSTFVGTVLALTSVTVNSEVTIQGRALARNGAVTLIDDTFNPTACAAQQPTTTTTTAPTTTTTAPGTTPTTVPGTTPVGGDGTVGIPIAGPGGSPTGPIAASPGVPVPVAGSPTGDTSTAAPTGGITTSSARPGSPSGPLARTGSPLGLTSLLGIALVTLGSAALGLGRRTGSPVRIGRGDHG